jgi:cell division ATPase FtsA
MNIFSSLFENRNKDKDLCLLVNIGNSFVIASLVLFEKNQKPNILYTKNIPITLEKKPKTESIEHLTLNYVENAILKVIKENPNTEHRHPSRILCTLSSPWFFSKNKKIEIENKNSFFITDNFIKDVLEKESNGYKEEFDSSSVEVIEKTIIDTKVNGYEITNPIGMKTQNVQFNMYLSIAPLDFIKKLENRLYLHTHIKKEHIMYHTLPLVFKEAISLVFRENSYSYVDISGEVTDITVVSDHLISYNLSLPFGRNTIIRQIAKELNCPYEVAISMLHTYQDNMLDEKTSSQIKEILERLQKEYYIYLDDALNIDDLKIKIPDKIFINTEDDTSNIFEKFIKEKSQLTIKDGFHIIKVTDPLFAELLNFDKKFSSDIHSNASAIFLSKFHQTNF